MKSDALITGFFWFFIIVGVLALAGIYWLFVVAVPGAITLGIFLYQIRLRKKTLANLKPRPETEIENRELVNKDYASYLGPKADLVELDRYAENHAEIAKTAQVSKPETLAMNGGVYAFSKTKLNSQAEISDVVILACVDFAVVGEVRAIEAEPIAKKALGAGGAAKVVIETKFNADGTVAKITMHPFSGKW
jgi:hypothetical protein